MKIVFFGTPDFACNVLEKLIESNHEIVGVVTSEDKKVGRKQILTESPVKVFAKKHNINVYQFKKIRAEGVDVLKAMNADIFVTCAYGQILSEEILNASKFGTINVHFSLLPKYRGACPVQAALLCGETQTGVTIMKTDVGIDTGDIIKQESIEIEKEDNTETLLFKLSLMGANLIKDVLEDYENSSVKFQKQIGEYPYFSMIKKEDGLIDFNKSSNNINNMVRAYFIWPNAYCKLDGKTLKIFKATETLFEDDKNYKLGEIVNANKLGLVVKCGNGTFLKLLELQLEGSKRMNYKDFLNGNKNLLGIVLNGNNA